MKEGMKRRTIDPAGALDVALAGRERELILEALERSAQERTRAARALGISRPRLYRRMKVLGIAVKKERGR